MGKLRKIKTYPKNENVKIDCEQRGCTSKACYCIDILHKNGIESRYFCEGCLKCEICGKRPRFIKIGGNSYKFFCSIRPCHKIKKLKE